MDYHFEMEKFWRKLKDLSLGTGALAVRAGVRPDDVQRLIALEEAPEDIAHKILEVLGREVLAYDPDEDDEEEQEADASDVEDDAFNTLTINGVKERIANGLLTLNEALEQEEQSDSPRSTLLAWLSDEMKATTTTTEGE